MTDNKNLNVVWAEKGPGRGLIEVATFTDIYGPSQSAVVDIRVLKMMFDSIKRVPFKEMKDEVINALTNIDNEIDFYNEIRFAITLRDNVTEMDKHFNKKEQKQL